MIITSVIYTPLSSGVFAIAEDGDGGYTVYLNVNLNEDTKGLVLKQIGETPDKSEKNIHTLKIGAKRPKDVGNIL